MPFAPSPQPASPPSIPIPASAGSGSGSGSSGSANSTGGNGVSSYISELLRKRAELDAEIRAAELAAAAATNSSYATPTATGYTGNTSNYIAGGRSVGGGAGNVVSGCDDATDQHQSFQQANSPLQQQQEQQQPKQQYLSAMLNDSSTNHTFTSSWDEMPRAIYDATHATIPSHAANQGYSSFYDGPDHYVDDTAPLCECGIPCIRLTSRTSANMNREFYKCANSTNPSGNGHGIDGQNEYAPQQCRFFEWVDKDTVDGGGSGGCVGGSNVIRDFRSENKRIFGHHSFRAGQRECIEAALEGVYYTVAIALLSSSEQ
jgi:hypothetical protein